jgi:protein TonB
MMPASILSPRDRAGALLAVLLVHALIAAALLTLGGPGSRERQDQPALETFDLALAPPPPPPVVEVRQERPSRAEGAAAPPNIESQATPVAAPEPAVELPVPSPVAAAPMPDEGVDVTQGAAPVVGPGTGAGGSGTGTGSGGSGGGPGDGGDGGEGTRPALASRSLTQRDYPSELRRRWPEDGRVLVIFSVQLNGRATDCSVFRSSGDPEIDAETCRLVERRLRFRPARDGNGVPYVDKYGYAQAPVGLSPRGG